MVLPSSKWRMGWECVSIWTSTIRQPKWIVPAGKASAIASMRSLLLKQRNSPFLPWRKFATIDQVHALCYPYNFLHWSLVIYLWESLIIFLYTHTYIYIIWCLAQKLSPTCCRKVSTKIHTWWFWNPSESGRTSDFFYRFAGFLLPLSCITPNKDCKILPLEKSTPNCPQIKYIADSATLIFFFFVQGHWCGRSMFYKNFWLCHWSPNPTTY